MPISTEVLSQEIMDCVPAIMRTIRAEMRSHRKAGLSIAQFRSMLFIHRNQTASLSLVAEHLGLTPPSTSSLIEDLVQRGLVLRSEVKGNRRQVQLNLTEAGDVTLSSAQEQTIRRLAQMLITLSDSEKDQALRILRKLRSIFE
jgi:DNA-binding MarR family transcriptional regulator